jgi:hypothetical protein
MQIRFHSDHGKTRSEFLGTWNTLFQPQSYTCPTNTYSTGLVNITSRPYKTVSRTEGGGCTCTPAEYLNTPIPNCLSTNGIGTHNTFIHCFVHTHTHAHKQICMSMKIHIPLSPLPTPPYTVGIFQIFWRSWGKTDRPKVKDISFF